MVEAVGNSSIRFGRIEAVLGATTPTATIVRRGAPQITTKTYVLGNGARVPAVSNALAEGFQHLDTTPVIPSFLGTRTDDM